MFEKRLGVGIRSQRKGKAEARSHSVCPTLACKLPELPVTVLVENLLWPLLSAGALSQCHSSLSVLSLVKSLRV